MAKRFEPINKFGMAKKLKLDISVNRGRLNAATSNIVDFWESDDDDVILLATQLAEENQNQNQRETHQCRNEESEFTFSEFVPQVHGTTSTQQIFVEPMASSCQAPKMTTDEIVTINLPSTLNVEEIFGTDETFVFLPDIQSEQKTSFEESKTGVTGKVSDSCLIEGTRSTTTSRRQLAQERQLKFLMERVDVLKKENGKLQKDLVDCTSQATTKDGEVSLLRNELRQARKLLQASKMEKMTLVEVEKDCNKKVAEAFKQVDAKNTELNFTNVEFTELKMRNAKKKFKENRMSSSIENNVESRNLLRLENLSIVGLSTNQYSSKTTGHIYEYAKETDGVKAQRNFFEVELDHLFLHYAQLQSQPSSSDEITGRIIMSVCRVFTEFWSYANSLELPQNCVLYPYNHYNLQSDSNLSMRRSLIQPDALYNMERALYLRRYIAMLALICGKQNTISQALLQKKHNNCWLIQIIIEAITKLSYSSEVSEHFGVLEAIGSLLKSLLNHLNMTNARVYSSGSQLELLFDLLKQLIFTRPSPWVFRELSACILLCCRQPKIMTRMCVNSPDNCFVSDRVRSRYRFGPKSCLIQVYAGLIELCFCSDLALQTSHFKLLLTMCENHVRFVYHCFTATPEFILRMLPIQSFIDDEKDDNKNSSKVDGSQSDGTLVNNTTGSIYASAVTLPNISSIQVPDQMSYERGCECYAKLCLSVVTLVFQMMYQWILQDKKTDISQVGEVSQIAVHLLTLIFREYYLPFLFRDSEETTKHNLSLLCDWWQDNRQLLNFKDTHLRFLRQLQELQFMLKPLHQEANLSNPSNDFDEWKRIINTADADLPKLDNQNVKVNSKNLFKYDKNDFFSGLKRVAYKFE